jgi:tol-pal system protein YbgF
MKKLLGILVVIFFCYNVALASSQELGPILQRQAKQIKELQTKIDSLEKNLNTIQSQLKTEYSEDNIGELSSLQNTPVNSDKNFFTDQPKTVLPRQITGSQDKIDYDLALAALKKGSLDKAEKMFDAFLQNYPDSKLAQNAVFWYGETFYLRGIFNKAALYYSQGYKKYPKGIKAADCLLKLSFSLARLNKNKEACSMLDKLDSEFTNRPIHSIKRSKDARSKFGCN